MQISMRNIIFLLLILVANVSFAQEQQHEKFEYKHNISIRFNPHFITKAKNIRGYHKFFYNNGYAYDFGLSYNYKVHKNISVGANIYAWTWKQQATLSHSITSGIFGRASLNRLYYVRPFVELFIGYEYWTLYNKGCYGSENQCSITNSFCVYGAPGISFHMFKNHLQLDLMCNFSNRGNIGEHKIYFSWRIGYNFNVEPKKQPA